MPAAGREPGGALGLNFSATCAEDLPFIDEAMIRAKSAGAFPDFAEEASRFMTKSRYVIVRRGGHGGGGLCTETLIRIFIDRVTVRGLNSACAGTVYGATRFALPRRP